MTPSAELPGHSWTLPQGESVQMPRWDVPGRGGGAGQEEHCYSPEHNSGPIRAALEPRRAETNKSIVTPRAHTTQDLREQGQALWCSCDPQKKQQDSSKTQTSIACSYLNVCLTALIRRSMIFSRSSREQLRSSVLSGFKSRAVIFPSSSISRTVLSDLRK